MVLLTRVSDINGQAFLRRSSCLPWLANGSGWLIWCLGLVLISEQAIGHSVMSLVTPGVLIIHTTQPTAVESQLALVTLTHIHEAAFMDS